MSLKFNAGPDLPHTSAYMEHLAAKFAGMKVGSGYVVTDCQSVLQQADQPASQKLAWKSVLAGLCGQPSLQDAPHQNLPLADFSAGTTVGCPIFQTLELWQ